MLQTHDGWIPEQSLHGKSFVIPSDNIDSHSQPIASTASALELENSAARWLRENDDSGSANPVSATTQKPVSQASVRRTTSLSIWHDASEAVVAQTLLTFYEDHEPEFANPEKIGKIIASYKKKAAKKTTGSDWHDIMWNAYARLGQVKQLLDSG
jgi:hypothetical protein